MEGRNYFEGFLTKKGGIRHNWLKRWFQLDRSNHRLMYQAGQRMIILLVLLVGRRVTHIYKIAEFVYSVLREHTDTVSTLPVWSTHFEQMRQPP